MKDLKAQLWCEHCQDRRIFSVAPAWNEADCLGCGERIALDGVMGATTEYLRTKAEVEWAKDVEKFKGQLRGEKTLGDVLFSSQKEIKSWGK